MATSMRPDELRMNFYPFTHRNDGRHIGVDGGRTAPTDGQSGWKDGCPFFLEGNNTYKAGLAWNIGTATSVEARNLWTLGTTPPTTAAGFLAGAVHLDYDASAGMRLYQNYGDEVTGNFDIAQFVRNHDLAADGVIISAGDVVPTAASAGYQKHGFCLKFGGAGTYTWAEAVNFGNETSCNFLIVRCAGTVGEIPADDTAGYAAGCEFTAVNATSFGQTWARNVGTAGTCDFDWVYPTLVSQ